MRSPPLLCRSKLEVSTTFGLRVHEVAQVAFTVAAARLRLHEGICITTAKMLILQLEEQYVWLTCEHEYSPKLFAKHQLDFSDNAVARQETLLALPVLVPSLPSFRSRRHDFKRHENDKSHTFSGVWLVCLFFSCFSRA